VGRAFIIWREPFLLKKEAPKSSALTKLLVKMVPKDAVDFENKIRPFIERKSEQVKFLDEKSGLFEVSKLLDSIQF